MANQLFARKPLAMLLEEMKGENRLRRVLGPLQLTALGVGAIIGAGIFVTTGAIAKQTAGPALMLSYVVAGMVCVFAALCYAEFASMVPVAGSAYTYDVRHPRRAVRVDHRLGPGARVRGRLRHRRQRLVWLLPIGPGLDGPPYTPTSSAARSWPTTANSGNWWPRAA